MDIQKKVLFIEWITSGRDFEIDFPLIYFFEKKLGWKVHYKSIFNLPSILNTNPDIVIMSNTTGASINVDIASLVNKSGFLLFSHSSEGFFRENAIEEMVYGWNKEKVLYENMTSYWSKRSYQLALNSFPGLLDKSFVSGSIGHDKYKIYSNDFKIEINNYKKIITYAAMDFHNMFSQYETQEQLESNPNYPYIKLINEILEFLVKEHKDILFIVKVHPGDRKKIPLEAESIEKYENVIFKFLDTSVTELIAVSDIWLSFRSSTNLEAWLLKKPSISFCEDQILLNDSEFIEGSVTCENKNKINNLIDEFYSTGKIMEFEEKNNTRNKFFENLIQFNDGYNHVRFMSILKPYIDNVESNKVKKGKWNLPIKSIIVGYIKHFVYSLSKSRYNFPILRRWANIYDIFNPNNLEKQKKLRYKDFDRFYEENKDEIENIYNGYNKNWKKELGIDN